MERWVGGQGLVDAEFLDVLAEAHPLDAQGGLLAQRCFDGVQLSQGSGGFLGTEVLQARLRHALHQGQKGEQHFLAGRGWYGARSSLGAGNGKVEPWGACWRSTGAPSAAG